MATFLLTTGDDAFDGSTGNDLFFGPSGGSDTLNGLDGNDAFRIRSDAAGSIDGGNGADTLKAVGFNLGTLTFSNMEKLNLGLGGITASAAQLNAFSKIFTTDGTSDVSIQFTGTGGSVDFGALWHGTQTLHIDAFGAGDGTGYTLTGTDRADIIAGSDFTDTIFGGRGDDILNTRGGTGDVLYGGSGDDSLTTYAAAITLRGGAGQDTLFSYSDGILLGGGGRDALAVQLGAPTVIGGHGPDRIRASAGSDTFIYNSVADSNGHHHDKIHHADLANDTWDVPGTVTGVDAAITQGTLDGGAAFDTTLAVAVNAANLAPNHAVLFTPDLGQLAGHIFLIVDVNGVSGYQADQDLVIRLIDPQNPASLATSDFI